MCFFLRKKVGLKTVARLLETFCEYDVELASYFRRTHSFGEYNHLEMSLTTLLDVAIKEYNKIKKSPTILNF